MKITLEWATLTLCVAVAFFALQSAYYRVHEGRRYRTLSEFVDSHMVLYVSCVVCSTVLVGWLLRRVPESLLPGLFVSLLVGVILGYAAWWLIRAMTPKP